MHELLSTFLEGPNHAHPEPGLHRCHNNTNARGGPMPTLQTLHLWKSTRAPNSRTTVCIRPSKKNTTEIRRRAHKHGPDKQALKCDVHWIAARHEDGWAMDGPKKALPKPQRTPQLIYQRESMRSCRISIINRNDLLWAFGGRWSKDPIPWTTTSPKTSYSRAFGSKDHKQQGFGTLGLAFEGTVYRPIRYTYHTHPIYTRDICIFTNTHMYICIYIVYTQTCIQFPNSGHARGL